MKVTQGNLKKTDIHVLHNAVKKLPTTFFVVSLITCLKMGRMEYKQHFNKICEKPYGLHNKSIYGLKKNKPYYESVILKIATA
jgi:hypothetical protein